MVARWFTHHGFWQDRRPWSFLAHGSTCHPWPRSGPGGSGRRSLPSGPSCVAEPETTPTPFLGVRNTAVGPCTSPPKWISAGFVVGMQTVWVCLVKKKNNRGRRTTHLHVFYVIRQWKAGRKPGAARGSLCWQRAFQGARGQRLGWESSVGEKKEKKKKKSYHLTSEVYVLKNLGLLVCTV